MKRRTKGWSGVFVVIELALFDLPADIFFDGGQLRVLVDDFAVLAHKENMRQNHQTLLGAQFAVEPTGLMQMHAAYTCALYNRLRFSGGLVAVDGHELKSLGTMCV